MAIDKDIQKMGKRGMTKIFCLCVILCFLFLGCTTTDKQSGYNPTFEKMKAGRWGGGW
jgi:hypothetical protein